MLKIFIGWDSRFPETAEVCKYSILRKTTIPVDIQFLKLDELNFNREYDPLQSTEFTYTRFLIPYLCNYEGTALFLDNDMLCLNDIRSLLYLGINHYTLRVVKHNYNPTSQIKMYGCQQTTYPRKNWSSFMYMNCARLKLWTKEFVEKATGAQLHRFEGIPDEEIGELKEKWNTLTYLKSETIFLHYTEGGPWFNNYQNCPHANLWLEEFNEMYRNRSVTK